MLLAAAWMKLGADPVLALRAVSWLAACGGLVLVQRLQRREIDPSPIVPAALWLLPLETWGYWSTSIMESMLYASGFVLAVSLSLREAREGRRRGSLPVFVALLLLRPETVVAFVLCHAAALLDERARRAAGTLRRHAGDAAIFAASLLGLTAWRLATYGALVPNTYAAKVTGGPEQWRSGIRYLAEWAAAEPIFALALLLGAASLVWAPLGRTVGSGARALAAIALGYVAVVVALGGDFMPFHRFLLPVLPLCAVLSSRFVALAAGRARLGAGTALLAAALLAAVQTIAGMAGSQRIVAFVSDRVTVVGLRVGRYFADTLPPDALIAVNTAGSLPYKSRLPTIDMLGLTDAAIAHHPTYVVSAGYAGHRRGWGDYVLSRRPRVVLWYNSAGSDEPLYLGDRELADNAFFRFFYQLHRVQLPDSRPSAPRASGSAGAPGPVLTRFFGSPLALGLSRGVLAREIGVRFEPRGGALSEVVALEAPATLIYFELRSDRVSLWPLRDAAKGDIDRFLTRVLETWRREDTASFDAASRREVDALCARALERIEAGQREEAKAILERALVLNARARSPVVYQYVANVAALEGGWFLAAQAQSEALRLDPDNALYRTNLLYLLSAPYEKLREKHPVAPVP